VTPQELGSHLSARIEGAVATISYDELTLDVPTSAWRAAATAAASDPDVACDYFDWLSAVDDTDTVAVVAHLYSPRLRHHVRLRTRLAPGVPLESLTPVFRGADWHERETSEMFGVPFTGGPTPDGPLLLPDGFEGSPLRKDFVLASRVVVRWPGLVEPRLVEPSPGAPHGGVDDEQEAADVDG
jgi:NADH-quinone oxidoreductase subunit C